MDHVPNRPLKLASQTNLLRWIKTLFILMMVAMGVLHAWAAATNSSMNPDGISYLDIGDAYFRGDWADAINPVWSPMYSWILGLVMIISHPSPDWEFPLVHLTNLLIYLLAFLGFEYYWRKLFQYHKFRQGAEEGDKNVVFPEWLWFALGYTFFIWSSLTLIKIWAVTPDMLMTFWVYLAAGLILKISLGDLRWRTFAIMGLVLGLGYLTKTIMLPVAITLLAVILFTLKVFKLALTRTLLAFTIFALLAGSFISLISISKNRLTYGEVGKLTYAWQINGIPYPHWQGGPPGYGTPEHPSRVIFEDPPIYEFAFPVPGTYPISYDPSYWYDGVTLRFGIRELLNGFLTNILFYLNLFSQQLGVALFGIAILYLNGSKLYLTRNNLIHDWGFAIVALTTLGLYALVYVEGRYIAVFVVLLIGEMLANVRHPNTQIARKFTISVGVIIASFILLNVFSFNLSGFGAITYREQRLSNQQTISTPRPEQVAKELHRLGINNGDRVGVIGYAFDSYWARLARVQIVSEMFGWDAEDFYLGDSVKKTSVYNAFASTGARAIIAERVPLYATLEEWHQVGNTNYYIYLLDK